MLYPKEIEVAENQKPEDGAVISGLFLEGARWMTDEHCIGESLPRELYCVMPHIHLTNKKIEDVPIVKGIPDQYTGKKDGTAHVYMCPVYKTSFRQGTLSTSGHSTNFVMFIRLPMADGVTQSHWVKRGCAALTGLDT